MSVLEGLDVFVAVCDAGSITGGGAALGLPRSTVSRQLKRLEEELGVRLLHRTTRRIVRSAAGEELYARARRLVDEAAAAREAVRRRDDVPRGRLRVSVPPDAPEAMTKMLLRFLRAYPEVQLTVVGTARHVDLVAEGFDVALRGGETTDPNLIARRLFRSQVRVFGSPGYLDARGRPESAGDLVDHDCIVGVGGDGVPRTHWPLLRGGAVKVSGRLVCDGLTMAIQAAAEGMGLAMLPMAPLIPTVANLEPVLEDEVGTSGDFAVVYAERALMLPKVRAFVDFVVAESPSLIPVL